MAKAIKSIGNKKHEEVSFNATTTAMRKYEDAAFEAGLPLMLKAGWVEKIGDSYPLTAKGEKFTLVSRMINDVLDRKANATDEEIEAELSFIAPEVIRAVMTFGRELVKNENEKLHEFDFTSLKGCVG